MTEIERVKSNIEIGYTMAVYGTCDNLHKQMLTDIETLAKHIEQGSKLPMHDVSCSSLNDLKKQLEIEKEDKERNKDNMFVSTYQDGKIEATKKAIDIVKGYCN